MLKKLTSILLVLAFLLSAASVLADRAIKDETVIENSPGEKPDETEAPAEPTEEPTEEPTQAPTDTPAPTEAPTETPTAAPDPTATPTPKPTNTPKPTSTPKPTDTPKPTAAPTTAPTAAPTTAPTATPTTAPTGTPTTAPTSGPTGTPVPTDVSLQIITANLPGGKVGEEYYAVIESNYADTKFSIYQSSSGPNQFGDTGLRLSSDSGRITGTPKNAGEFTFYVSATSQSAGATVTKKFTIVIGMADPTPTPTAAPTAAPTAVSTNVPTNTPSTSQPPAPTTVPVVTATPTVAPTQQGSYIAFPLWKVAADTIQEVETGEPFEIRLIEGLSEHLTFSNLYGNLPASVEFVNDFANTRSCSVKGSLTGESSYEFAVEFSIKGGKKIMINFRLVATEKAVDVGPVFPLGRYLVPFGGTQTAMLPIPFRKKEEV